MGGGAGSQGRKRNLVSRDHHVREPPSEVPKKPTCPVRARISTQNAPAPGSRFSAAWPWAVPAPRGKPRGRAEDRCKVDRSPAVTAVPTAGVPEGGPRQEVAGKVELF